MSEEFLSRGFDLDASQRLAFRSLWLIQSIEKRKEVLRAGNLASWEPEIELLNAHIQDLSDVVKELIILLNITINQTEQGVALPPNGTACPSDAA